MNRYSGLLHQLVHKSEVLERFQVVNVQCSHGTIKEHLALLAKNFTDAFLLVLTVIYKRERRHWGERSQWVYKLWGYKLWSTTTLSFRQLQVLLSVLPWGTHVRIGCQIIQVLLCQSIFHLLVLLLITFTYFSLTNSNLNCCKHLVPNYWISHQYAITTISSNFITRSMQVVHHWKYAVMAFRSL